MFKKLFQEELLDDVNINRILLQTKIRQLNAQIPVNRQMKADIVRVRNDPLIQSFPTFQMSGVVAF